MNDHAETASAEKTCDWEGMRAPVAQHKLFEPFVGTFKATVTMHMGPGDPMIATGEMVNELEFDGLFLRQHYTGDQDETPFPAFHGRGYWAYNKIDERYEGVWIDNACSWIMTEQGQVDDAGKVWTMHGTMTDPGNGKRIARRSMVLLKDNDHHRMEMYHHPEGGEERLTMAIDYVRA